QLRSSEDVRRMTVLTLEADLAGSRRDVSEVPQPDSCSAVGKAHLLYSITLGASFGVAPIPASERSDSGGETGGNRQEQERAHCSAVCTLTRQRIFCAGRPKAAETMPAAQSRAGKQS